MIVLLQDGGGVQVIKFKDVESLDVIDGGKTMMGLGSRRPSTLLVYYHNGRDRDAISIGRDGEWGRQAAQTIIQLHQRFAIRDA